MLKQTILAATIFLFSGLSANSYEYYDQCNVGCCDPCNVGGFYVGVGVGRAFSNGNWKNRQDLYNEDFSVLVHSSQFKYDTGGEGSTESIMFGYGKQFCNRFYLGAEVFATASDLGGDLYRNDIDFFGEFNGFHVNPWRLRIQYTLGASILPGYYVSPESLYYLRFGVVRSKISMNVNYDMELPFNNLFSNFPQIRHNQNGFQFGIGNEIQLTSCLSFRQEYSYEHYGKESDSRATFPGGNDFGTPANIIRTSSIKPTQDKFSWSLLYHFCRQDNAPDWCSPVSGQGIYYYMAIGGSRNAGNSWSESKLERIFRDVFATPPDDLTVSIEPSYTNDQLRNYNGLIGIGAGYLFCNKFFVGGEIVGGLATGNEVKSTFKGLSGYFENWTQKFTARDLYNVSFSIRPGYQINERFSFFARIGAIMNVSKVHSKWDIAGNDILAPQPALNEALSYKRTVHLWGFITGLGLETVLCDNITLTTESNFTFFGKSQRVSDIFAETTSSDFFPATDFGVDTSKKSHGASFTLALTYYFGH